MSNAKNTNNQGSDIDEFNSDIVKENKKKAKQARLSLNKLLLISSKSLKYQFYNIFITFMCLISSMVYAYYAAFRYDVEEDHASQNINLLSISMPESKTLDKIELIIELIFLGDMIIRFCSEYTPIDSIYPVRDIILISKHYLKT
jgi:hypothetical protein